MAVADFLPRTMPLIVGTEQIEAYERASGRHLVSTMAPPVDLEFNDPALPFDVEGFRREWSIDPNSLTIGVVTRLAAELKLEGLLTAIEVVGELATQRRVQLVIVGDGPARDEVEACARAANNRAGTEAIVITGELLDPRRAYACADIMLGMGGSALRALAFGKPLVVQGEAGFWQLLTPSSANDFRWTGWYGVGDGRDSGPAALRAAIQPLIDSPARRIELGDYSLHLVRKEFSLDGAANFVDGRYNTALQTRTRHSAATRDLARSASLFANHYARRKLAKIAGRAARDDFNGSPVARGGPTRDQRVRS